MYVSQVAAGGRNPAFNLLCNTQSHEYSAVVQMNLSCITACCKQPETSFQLEQRVHTECPSDLPAPCTHIITRARVPGTQRMSAAERRRKWGIMIRLAVHLDLIGQTCLPCS